jgi:phenylalanyl-tRNA synthetase beta chain
MKVSYKWLKEYVSFDLSADELAARLTMAGLEVEEVTAILPEFKGVIVARVVSVDKHPNADKLSVCQVDTGSDRLQVICGAPNVAAGQYVPFAPVNTSLPIGLTIKKARIRDVDSFGMICSEEELGLAEKSSGIWVLDNEYPLGEDLYQLLAKDKDFVLDISITPNRPDAMSMVGVAREVAALLDTTYKKPGFSLQEVTEEATNRVKIQIADPEGCPRYAARVIGNVKIGPSPEWLANRLKAGGVRPINNIVDVTNYVLLELGQPLHAFDLATLSGSQIIVRESSEGEKFTTLDEKERSLPPRTVMICDAEKAVAIGGIMGGLNSEVSDQTTDILLESAYFNPARIAAASKRLGLSSEASQRFERGVDPAGISFACDRAAFLIAELAGGTVLQGTVDVYPKEITAREVPLRPARVNHLLGTSLQDQQIADIMRRLGISFKNQQAVVPTYRPDLEREVDLIEEVARLIGFENIPLKRKSDIEYDAQPNREDWLHQLIKSEIRALGFYEVLTNSMIALRDIKDIEAHEPVKILNPISDDMNVMRRSLLPGLLKVLCFNLNRNASDLRLFEMGRVFLNIDREVAAGQPYYIAGVLQGSRNIPDWSRPILDIDFYDVKGVVEAFLDKIFLDKYEFILYDNTVYFEAGQTLGVDIDNEITGYFGKIKTDIAARFDIDSDVYGYEFSVDVIKNKINQNQLFEIFSRYPFVEKDLAFVVDAEVAAADIEQLIYQSGKPLVRQVSVFDLYKGKQLGDSRKSIAFRIRFQSSERTLNEKEVSKIFNKIISDAERKLKAKLRE